jgi:ABC-type spermidine/putrescine transport system permease subunit I
MLGSIVLQEFGTANDWPQGAAIGIAIMVIGLTFLAVVAFFARVEGQIE